jgi:hypothetical protein
VNGRSAARPPGTESREPEHGSERASEERTAAPNEELREPEHRSERASEERTAAPNEELPQLRIEASPTFVISAAIATRDFQDVHHDRDRAIDLGSRDIFVNILTTTGLVQRFVTDWAGPGAVVRGIAIRLGVPCYAHDTLIFSGRVSANVDGECHVDVVGRTTLGEHVTGTVRVVLA